MLPTACQRSSMILAPMRRRCALSLEKAIMIRYAIPQVADFPHHPPPKEDESHIPTPGDP